MYTLGYKYCWISWHNFGFLWFMQYEDRVALVVTKSDVSLPTDKRLLNIQIDLNATYCK